ncbi:MAG: DUF1097 domain-containing protein [Propylenella sp.]
MDLIVALAISIGALGGIATWIVLGPLGAALQVWAIFIAWACFYHCGGKETGLKNTIICNIVGAVLAWIALLIVTNTGGIGGALPGGLWAGIVVGVTVFVLVLLAKVPALATIPAMVYGYAAVAAFGLLSPTANVTAGDFTNPLITIVVSMVVGAVLGYISEKIAGAMAK